jgi:phosphatidylglycerol:prolipoprotein diacylglycerol transferase
MHPTLVRLGSFGLPTYGVAMALGFLAAILLGVRSARRQGISVERLLDLSFWILGASLIGSRLAYAVTRAPEFVQICAGTGAERSLGRVLFDCTRSLHIWEGGYVFYGGYVAAILVSIWYTRRHQMGFFRVADLTSPLVALGHFFGRLGCFAAGCCYGKPAPPALGVAFPPGSLVHAELSAAGLLAAGAAATMPLYPTQLYEALAELAIFVLLVVRGQRRTYYGQVFVTYLWLYPSARAAIELFRGDPDRGYLWRLSTPTLNRWLGIPPDSASLLSVPQAIGLLAVGSAVALSRVLRRRSDDLGARRAS